MVVGFIRLPRWWVVRWELWKDKRDVASFLPSGTWCLAICPHSLVLTLFLFDRHDIGFLGGVEIPGQRNCGLGGGTGRRRRRQQAKQASASKVERQMSDARWPGCCIGGGGGVCPASEPGGLMPCPLSLGRFIRVNRKSTFLPFPSLVLSVCLSVLLAHARCLYDGTAPARAAVAAWLANCCSAREGAICMACPCVQDGNIVSESNI